MNQKYRIIEKTYSDNHKEYIAQYLFLNFGLFKIWQNYICDTLDYGYGQIRCICAGKTFDECKNIYQKLFKRKKLHWIMLKSFPLKNIIFSYDETLESTY